MAKRTISGTTLIGSIFFLLMYTMKFSNGMPLKSDATAKIIMYKNEGDAQGNYEYGFETDNNIYVKQTGRIKHTDEGVDIIVVEGSYSYQTGDNKVIVVNYIADEGGFRQNLTIKELEPPEIIDIRVSSDLLASLVGGMG